MKANQMPTYCPACGSCLAVGKDRVIACENLPGSTLTGYDLIEQIESEVVLLKMVRPVLHWRVADRGPDGPTVTDLRVYEITPGPVTIRVPSDQLELVGEYPFLQSVLEWVEGGEPIALVPFSAERKGPLRFGGLWVGVSYWVE